MKRQQIILDNCIHEVPLSRNRKHYCRALNSIVEFDGNRCMYCPLFNGDLREVHCMYFDLNFKLDGIVTPSKMKKYIDGMIAVGLTKEFPYFVDEYKNFAGRAVVEKWNMDDMLLLEKAIQYAAEAHRGDVRKGTKIPYIVHPLEVCVLASEMTSNINAVCAAVLHDVVEDTKYTIEDIRSEFGTLIAELVGAESENKREGQSEEATWEIRKEEFLAHLESAPLEAKIIALADKLANIRSLVKEYQQTGEKVWEKFNQKDKKKQGWYYWSIAELTRELSDTLCWTEYEKLCEKTFGGK